MPDAATDLDVTDLDRSDPLSAFRQRFAAGGDPIAYLDGNSLGRPPVATLRRLERLLQEEWATDLIRGWQRWVDLPLQVGDDLGATVLGAAPGQTLVADSTSVCLYKALHAAVRLRPHRDELVVAGSDFPTDRFLATSVAAERGLQVRRLDPDPIAGVRTDDLHGVLGERTAVLLLSHVDYRSAAVADLPVITAAAHDAGAVVVWDLSHSAGAVQVDIDDAGVDLAVGCTYKYLNAGPGAPAFLYAAAAHHDRLVNVVPGWFGADDVFAMAESHVPAPGIRRMLSGTPSVPGLVAVQEGVRLVAEAGLDRIRAKGRLLTGRVVEAVGDAPAALGWRLASPREAERRGSHVSVAVAGAQELVGRMAARGVLADFRAPDLVRLGLSPLTTSIAELDTALAVMAEESALLRTG